MISSLMPKPQVLIVDDDCAFAEKLRAALDGVFGVVVTHSDPEFREQFAVGRFDLVILDMRLEKNREGLVLLKEVCAMDPGQAAIVMTAFADAETYSDALESGALTYLDKREFSPILIARTAEAIAAQGVLRKRVMALERRLDSAEPLELIGASPAIVQVRDQLRRAADSDRPVLIWGEAGSGKELVARNIHRLSRRRREGAFVLAICDRLPRQQVQRALFGVCQRPGTEKPQEFQGWVDEARGGILFVRGTTTLDQATISALFRYIESQIFVRQGGRRPIEGDAQVVFSVTTRTEPPLSREKLREQVIGRLRGLEIDVPPLRDRVMDIPLIIQYTLQNLYRQGRVHTRSIAERVTSSLEGISWPGNVRELKIAIEYAAVRADVSGAREICPEHLPTGLSGSSVALPEISDGAGYLAYLARAELALVEGAIAQLGIAKKATLTTRLGYNDRFTFSRRIRRILGGYPGLETEFPNAARLFASRSNIP